MEKRTQFSLWYFAAAILAVLVLQDLWVGARTTAPIPYSEFQALVKEGKVTDIAIADNQIHGSFKEPREGKSRFVTTRVDPELAKDLAQHDVRFSGVVESTFLRDVLGWVVPAVVFIGIWLFVMRRFADKMGGGGFMSIGKSKAKVYVETDTKVDFADVAGVDEAKEELQEIVGFLKDPKRFGRLGGRAPKGVLLVGPPGTGKTLLARAVAGEAGVPFFSISGSEFVEMFVGVGAARVRDLFEQARAKAPAIIFIDELDALGRARASAGAIGGHDEKEQTLNQLLVELDGFDGSKGLVLLGATNRPEVLDPALLRAGRFDRQVVVDRPDKTGRIAILDVHTRKITLAPGVDTAKVADLTPGFTGAELANLCNEAALAATRRDADAVTLDDFTVAIERIVAGLEKKSRVLVAARARGRRAPRDGARAGRDGRARRRPGAQGLDHPARRRRARLHYPAPDRGAVPDDARGAREPHGGAARRPRRRGDRLRALLDRRLRRPAARHRDRPRDRHPLRHGRRDRPRCLRRRAPELPRAGGADGERQAVQRGDRARDRHGRPRDRRGDLPAHA